MFTLRIMLRIYRRPQTSISPDSDGRDLKTRFDTNAGGTAPASFEGMEAIDYQSDTNRAAVIGPITWIGKYMIFCVVVCM